MNVLEPVGLGEVPDMMKLLLEMASVRVGGEVRNTALFAGLTSLILECNRTDVMVDSSTNAVDNYVIVVLLSPVRPKLGESGRCTHSGFLLTLRDLECNRPGDTGRHWILGALHSDISHVATPRR